MPLPVSQMHAMLQRLIHSEKKLEQMTMTGAQFTEPPSSTVMQVLVAYGPRAAHPEVQPPQNGVHCQQVSDGDPGQVSSAASAHL